MCVSHFFIVWNLLFIREQKTIPPKRKFSSISSKVFNFSFTTRRSILTGKNSDFFRFCGPCLRHSYNFVQNFYTFFVLISNLDIEKQFFWYFGSRSTPFRERGICERKKGFRDSVMFSTNWLYKINVYVFWRCFHSPPAQRFVFVLVFLTHF